MRYRSSQEVILVSNQLRLTLTISNCLSAIGLVSKNNIFVRLMDPQNPKPPENQKLQTRLFSNVELEEVNLKLTKRTVCPTFQLNRLPFERNLWPHITGWKGGLYKVMNSLDLMKAFAVANDTWEEEKKKEEEKEELIPLHIPDPIP